MLLLFNATNYLTVAQYSHAIVDLLTATYIHSTLEETTNMLARYGFSVMKRLSGADSTSYDLDRVEEDQYGKEKFGLGELRLLCRLDV